MTKTLRSVLKGLLLAGVFSLSMVRPASAVTTDAAVITVTPIADVSLTLNVTSYAFGPLAISASSNSATALTLTNNGQINITVDKRITTESNPVGWTAGTVAGMNTYVLYVATSTTRLSLPSFTAATKFGAQNNITNLTGPAGTQPVMPTSGAGSSVDLWFRLDMPTSLTSGVARTMTVRFTGTAQ